MKCINHPLFLWNKKKRNPIFVFIPKTVSVFFMLQSLLQFTLLYFMWKWFINNEWIVNPTLSDLFDHLAMFEEGEKSWWRSSEEKEKALNLSQQKLKWVIAEHTSSPSNCHLYFSLGLKASICFDDSGRLMWQLLEPFRSMFVAVFWELCLLACCFFRFYHPVVLELFKINSV